MNRRRWHRPASRAVALVLATCALAGSGGCASSRWVDANTPGDLWGTSGTELGAVKLLGKPPPGRNEARSAEPSGDAEAALDLMIELVLLGLASW